MTQGEGGGGGRGGGWSYLVQLMMHLVEDESSVIICSELFDNTVH